MQEANTVDSASINSSGVRGSQEAHGRACQSHHVLENKRVAVYEQQHGCGHLRAAPAFPGSTHILILWHPCCQHLRSHHMRSAHDAVSQHGIYEPPCRQNTLADCNPEQECHPHCQKQHMTLYMRSAPARVNRVLPLRQHEKTQQLFRHNSNYMHLYKTGRLNLTSTMRERR